MTPELEQWIQDHSRDLYGSGTCWLGIIRADDLRALLEGKVLCDAKPSRYINPDYEGQKDSVIATVDPTGLNKLPLYKAAGDGEE